MGTLTLINPSPLRKGKRKMAKRRRKSGKRSAAQRRATAKMLAANRRINPKGTKMAKRRRRKSKAVSSAPTRKYRRRSARRASRGGGRSFGSVSAGIVPMLKSAAFGAGGALAVDVAMGYAAKVLPATMVSPINADGSPNYSYYAAKGALAIGMGMVGKRFLPNGLAAKMAEGSLVVTLHNAAATMIPAGGALALGWASPARIVNREIGMGNVRGISEYVTQRNGSRMNEYMRRT